jgi:hypothetical protein
MAIENNDLFVVQKGTSGDLRKASVATLLSDVISPALPEVISDLNDVSDNAPSNGQVLKWNGVEWVPADDEVRDLSNYLEKPGREGTFVINESSDGTITYVEAIDGGEYS